MKTRRGHRKSGNVFRNDPGYLWRLYLQLVEVEQAFKELKNDLSIRPIYHQLETRIEAHISIAFLAYCLWPDAEGSARKTRRHADDRCRPRRTIGCATRRMPPRLCWRNRSPHLDNFSADAVTALCVLPDGRLASGSGDHTIRLWDVTAGAETARLEGHSDVVTALCVLPDGRLASGSGDQTIRLWDVTAGAETARLEGHSGVVSALCVLHAGSGQKRPRPLRRASFPSRPPRRRSKD
jgi:WD40 repeat protein